MTQSGGERSAAHSQGPPSAHSVVHWHERLDRPLQLGALRADARDFLGRNNVAVPRRDEILIALTELVTNAEEQVGTDGIVTVEIDCTRPNTTTVVVTNEPVVDAIDPTRLRSQMPGPDALRGRGLPLVAAFAARLSFDSIEGRTRVQADFTG